MTAKLLRKIISKIPDDTMICMTDGESGCRNLDSVRYCPQYSILYIDPYWSRETTSNIDMNPSKLVAGRPKLDKYTLARISDFAYVGKHIVEEKKDGKKHHVSIILTIWDEYLFGGKIRHLQWLSLVVDDTREGGGKLGVGRQFVVCEFDWESLVTGEKKGREQWKV